jgi:glycine/D-amino acid oxidase-like deaminating enzyme
VVIGAGMVGAATANELSARGVDVLLLDSGEVSGGTTGLGEGNVLCSDKNAGPELELTVHGRALYAELEERYGALAQVRRKGALIVHPDPATWAGEAARLERLRAAGVEGELIEAAHVRELEPALTGKLCGALYVPDDLQCAPRAIARALAAEVPRVRTHARVERIEADPPGVVLEGGEHIAADAVVLAAGPWSAALAATAGHHLPVEPRWGQLVQLGRPPGAPLFRGKVVDGSYLGSVTSGGAELQLSTVLETTAEGDVLIGSSRARRGFDDAVDPEVSEAMIARAATFAPAVAALPVARAWSGLRPWLPDHRPAIGPSATVAGLWLATGHEGAGVALGPVTGRLVAQLLTGEAPLMDPAPFDPDRFAALASAR